jgi:hypothetical protein
MPDLRQRNTVIGAVHGEQGRACRLRFAGPPGFGRGAPVWGASAAKTGVLRHLSWGFLTPSQQSVHRCAMPLCDNEQHPA